MVTRITSIAEAREAVRRKQGTLRRCLLVDAKLAFAKGHDVHTIVLRSGDQIRRLAKRLRTDGHRVTTFVAPDVGRLHIWRDEPGEADEAIRRFNHEVSTAVTNTVVIQDVPEWAGLAIVDGLWDAGYRAKLVHDDETGPAHVNITWDQHKW